VKSRRRAVLGLGLLASAALAVAACGTQQAGRGGGGVSPPSASPTPANSRAAVLDSTEPLGQMTYKYTYKYTESSASVTGSGVVDPAAKKITESVQSAVKTLQGSATFKLDAIAIGADKWIKLDYGTAENQTLGVPPTKYMRIDRSKLNHPDLPFGAGGGDPGDAASLFKGLVDAQRVDNQHYGIKLDLTQTNAASVPKSVLTTLGDKAKAVPGTVALDDQGRLSEVNVDLSSVDPTSSIKVTYSDYGSAVTVNPPLSSETIDAPKGVYDLLNLLDN
jgi:hypothetical protein